MKKAYVLLVEDDSSIGIVVTAALAAENIDVVLCDSASGRDTALSNDKFDVMITDVLLKDCDGIANLSNVKTAHPDMPIIVISAQNTLDTAIRASEIDAFEYFPKPFDLNDLVVAVKQAIEKKRHVPGARLMENDGIVEANIPMVGRSAAMQDVYRMVLTGNEA